MAQAQAEFLQQVRALLVEDDMGGAGADKHFAIAGELDVRRVEVSVEATGAHALAHLFAERLVFIPRKIRRPARSFGAILFLLQRMQQPLGVRSKRAAACEMLLAHAPQLGFRRPPLAARALAPIAERALHDLDGIIHHRFLDGREVEYALFVIHPGRLARHAHKLHQARCDTLRRPACKLLLERCKAVAQLSRREPYAGRENPLPARTLNAD